MNYQCGICFEEQTENNIVKTCNNTHFFCNSCFNSFIQHILNEDIDSKTFLCPLCRNENNYIKNGLITTYFNEFDSNSGNLKIRANYNNNQLHGLYEEFYENCNLASKFTIFYNKMEGERIEYYDNGNIWLKCNYLNGQKEGNAEEYYENGQLWKRITYKNGIRIPDFEEWSINGIKIVGTSSPVSAVARGEPTLPPAY
jgi:hypothetical protein